MKQTIKDWDRKETNLQWVDGQSEASLIEEMEPLLFILIFHVILWGQCISR
jgi:hypothetical protein